MGQEKGISGFVQIAIAVIGVLGSLGVAWITTGAKFESELKENQASVNTLRTDVNQISGTINPVIDTLGKKQAEVDQKISELTGLLQTATEKNSELERNLASIQAKIDSAQTSTQALTNASQTAQQRINQLQAIKSIRPELNTVNK